MAWSFIANRGTNTSKASSGTVTVNPTATIAVGRILVVWCVSDDTTGSGPTHAVSDTGGNTYEQLEFSSGNSDAAGCTISLHITKVSTQLTTGSTVTLTLGTNRVSKVIGLSEFSLGAGNTYALAGNNTAGGSGTATSVAVSGLSLIARLWLGLVGAEGPSGDSFTNDVDYSAGPSAGTTGNPAAGNITLRSGYRLATQTGDTYATTITSRDWRTLLVAINETSIPAAKFAADVSATATTTSALTTSITMAASVSASATAEATGMVGAGILFEAAISAQANATARLTTPSAFSSMSDYLENELIKHIFRTGSFTKPTQLWISLHTADPTDDATGTEVSGNNYGRVQLNPGDANWQPTDGENSLTFNLAVLNFPAPSASWGQVTHAAIWDAQTLGNMLIYGELTSPRTVGVGTGPAFGIGGIQVNLSIPPEVAFPALEGVAIASATATASFGTVYAQANFEDQTYGDFTDNSDPVININTNQVKNGTYSAEIYYQTNPVGHNSDDHSITYDFGASGIDHFFVSGWFRIKTPEVGGATGIQRKLIYIWADPSSPALKWSLILGVWDVANPNSILNLVFTNQNAPIGGSSFNIDGGTSPDAVMGLGNAMAFDAWYFIEWEVKNNTQPSSPWDGEIRVWLTPSGGETEQVLDLTGYGLNRDSGYNLRLFHIGQQVDTQDEAANEYRYWDDVAITSYYRGPT